MAKPPFLTKTSGRQLAVTGIGHENIVQVEVLVIRRHRHIDVVGVRRHVTGSRGSRGKRGRGNSSCSCAIGAGTEALWAYSGAGASTEIWRRGAGRRSSPS